MSEMEGARVADHEQVQEVRKAKPTPITLACYSTPLYQNDPLFMRTLDELLARYNVVRIIAEEGSAVATMAKHWCKRHKVRLTWILKDAAFAERDDRVRRARYVVEERSALALIFNQFDRVWEIAGILHGGGVPVSIVRPSDDNSPNFVSWRPGMTQGLAVPSMREIARNVRRGRPKKKKLSEAEARERQANAKRLWNERARLKKLAMDPRPLAFGVFRRKPGRPRKAVLG